MTRILHILILVALVLTGCSANDPVTLVPEPADPTNMPQPPASTTPSATNPTLDPNQPVPYPGDPSMTPDPNNPVTPLTPQPDDGRLVRGQVFLDSVQMLVAESYPVQVRLVVSGSLPTPCHKLRATVNSPDANKDIQVDIYSLVDPDAICIQVLQAFDTQISLGAYPPGHYRVYVNGELVGEFDT